MRTAIDFAIAAFVVFAIALVISGLGVGMDHYDEVKAAQQEEAKAQRLAAALRDLCGENGVAIEQADGAYRCYTKRGYRTTTVAEVRP